MCLCTMCRYMCHGCTCGGSRTSLMQLVLFPSLCGFQASTSGLHPCAVCLDPLNYLADSSQNQYCDTLLVLNSVFCSHTLLVAVLPQHFETQGYIVEFSFTLAPRQNAKMFFTLITLSAFWGEPTIQLPNKPHTEAYS